MSSGFVSGGTTEKPVVRDDEWLRAQEELEATRRRKEESSRQEGGKTLYEVLQANKEAKQEAFEESIRLKNQFRNLDEDEVEFLDSVLESTRAKEEAVKKETAEQLKLFRRQQEEADKALLSEGGDTIEPSAPGKPSSPSIVESKWAINSRKRKRAKEKEGLKGVKLRKPSTSELSPVTATSVNRLDDPAPALDPNDCKVESDSLLEENTAANIPVSIARPDTEPLDKLSVAETTQASKGTLSGLGLAGYSSDED